MEKLSEIKQKILKILSSREWISSSFLLKETEQKYFDRRIRELRDELGYDIEMKKFGTESHYRLKSLKKNKPKPRTYLGPTDKAELLKVSNNLCSLCGKTFSPSKLVLDHRAPLIRGGGGTKENFQVVCIECNNQKRTSCKGCEKDCSVCFLAYPEKFEANIQVLVDPSLKEKLLARAEQEGMDISTYVNKVLAKNL